MFRVLAGVALALWSVQARASSPQVWQGEAFITGTTGACATNAVATVDDYYRMIYRPKLASTDAAEGLAFVGSRSSYLATSLAGNAMFQGSGTYSGRYISSRAITGSSTGSFSLSVSPAPITSSTGTIVIFGTLTNFFAATGCDITFRMVATPRP